MAAGSPSQAWSWLCTLGVIVVLAPAACTADPGSASSVTASSSSSLTSSTHWTRATAAPIPTGREAAELQARAMARAYAPGSGSRQVVCMVGDVSTELREAIDALYPAEVEYFETLADIQTGDGGFRCHLVMPRAIQVVRPDVVGIDVSVTSSNLGGWVQTYLFRWDGSQWIDSTPEETGVTVTSLVS